MNNLTQFDFVLDANNYPHPKKLKAANISGKLDALIDFTKFLPDDVSIQERFYVYKNGIQERVKCKFCNKNFVKFNSYKKGYTKYCSIKCATRNPETNQKRNKTNIDRYGHENPFGNDNIKDKIQKTFDLKYGGRPLQSKNVYNKMTKTNLLSYGHENVRSSKRIIEKIHNSIIENFGSEKAKNRRHNPYAFMLLESKAWLSNQYSLYPAGKIAEILNVHQTCVSSFLRYHNIISNKWKCNNSYPESMVFEYIKNVYKNEIIRNTKKIIPPKELDIYIPEKNLAIEFNGLYHHSDVDDNNKNYHLNKTIRCEKQGIQLLHIFENEWNEKQEIWKSVIKAKLDLNERIYARKCVIKDVSNIEGYRFFEENHLQGGLSNGKHIGLYYNNKLVCCISYGKSRFEKDVYEIYRYANLIYNNVIGGFSKLLKHLPTPIISYANRRWSNGNLYEKNGFKLISVTDPNYFYVVQGELHSRQRYQKHKLKGMKSYDENLTEEQIMELEGYRRIYDCGNLKYIKV